MVLMIILIFFSFFIGIVMWIIGNVLSFLLVNDREKSSSFECGFDSIEFLRNPFSVRFFLISVQFLIFDVEISLVLPLPLSYNLYLNLSILFSIMIFLLLVTFGFLHEWNEGSLDWK